MSKHKVDIAKLEFAKHPPAWVLPIDSLRISADEQDIIEFFLFNTPCKNTSAREVPLTTYQWEKDNPPKNGYLHKRILETGRLKENDNLFIGKEREDMKDVFQLSSMGERFFDEYRDNRIAFLCSGNFVLDLFKSIRNSLAHGRFNVIGSDSERLFVMENGQAVSGKFEVKARMLIKAETLSTWIRIVKTEAPIENEQRKEAEARRIVKQDKMLLSARNAVAEGKIIKQEDFKKLWNSSPSKTEQLIRLLKARHGVMYSPKDHRWVLASDLAGANQNS